MIFPKLIVPKVGEDISNGKPIEAFIKDKIELQLLSTDMLKYKDFVKAWIDKYPRIETYILHIPFLFVTVFDIYSSQKLQREFNVFVSDMIKLSMQYKKHFHILFHMATPMKTFEYCGGVEYVKYLDRLIQDTDVNFLVENSTFTLENRTKEGGPFYQLVKQIDSPKIRCCFDICHNQINKNLYQSEYDLPADIGKYTKSIHFSSTLNHDGFIDKKTHGRAHENIGTLIDDLEFLQNHGFDLNTTFLVTEINEDDYVKRPDLIKELKNLEQIRLSLLGNTSD